MTASKRTPVGQVRRLICEISGLDRMTWRIQENSKVLGTQEGDNLPAKGTQSQTANQIAQALTGYYNFSLCPLLHPLLPQRFPFQAPTSNCRHIDLHLSVFFPGKAADNTLYTMSFLPLAAFKFSSLSLFFSNDMPRCGFLFVCVCGFLYVFFFLGFIINVIPGSIVTFQQQFFIMEEEAQFL